jgi:NADPH-dependent 2,4-dienoyl-CoA reductase/sulfur reductase-like enzyme
MADSRAIMARAATARRAVVLGSGFIGLEVAAALRGRGLEVHVVSLEQRSLERIVGPQLGDFIQRLHESKGVVFHLRSSLVDIGRDHVVLDNGKELAADLVVLGAGVKPRSALAEVAGLATTDGILTDEYLETDVPGVYAAGDVARWRDVDGRSRRVEHWVVAQRQGQLVAENMLGGRKPFATIPFFWSTHYDLTIRYVGHAAGWDEAIVEGEMEARDCAVIYRRGGLLQAVATIGRDVQSLEYERQLERSMGGAGAY